MRKKRIVSTVLLILFVVLVCVQLLVFGNLLQRYFAYSVLSGRPIGSGFIGLLIDADIDFTIISPTDAIYPFNASSAVFNNGHYEFPLSLAVTTAYNITDWNYTLYHGSYGIYYDTSFIPNITMYVRPGTNILNVSVLDNESNFLAKQVQFVVNVQNSSPVIEFNESFEVFACDGQSFEFLFNITDLDDLSQHSVSVQPQNPFFPGYNGRLQYGIFEGRVDTRGFLLEQSDVESHNLTVRVVDLFFSDQRNLTVTVLDVNKEPIIDDLGAQLIWNNGDDANFYYQWSADDVDEDGNLSAGVMNVSLTYQNGSAFTLFNISSSGVMNFTADNTTALGTYPLQVCATDTALSNPHANLTLHCNETGAANVVCDNFTLTVTDTNRAPEILTVYPLSLSVSATATISSLFNVSAYDPDENPIDIEWYVAGTRVLRTSLPYNVNKLYNDTFLYTFPCALADSFLVTVNVTDGDLYDSFTWNVTLDKSLCVTPETPPSGGGGGGGSPFCYENWVCPEWNPCLHVDTYFQSGILDIFSYNLYRDQCAQLGLNSSLCGFQTRSCLDLNQCEVNIVPTPKPGVENQACYYVEFAGCRDGVKNCHSGACELLTDCGGPCGPCPTCRDGLQNQGETGVDCGGPCLDLCPVIAPVGINYLLILLIILLLLLIIFIIYALYRLIIILLKRKEDRSEDGAPALEGSQRKKRIQRLLDEKKKRRGEGR